MPGLGQLLLRCLNSGLGQLLLRCLNSGIGQLLLRCLNSGIGQLLLRCLNSGIHALAMPSPCRRHALAMPGKSVSRGRGFRLWLAFAWFYEFTPSELKRESEIAPADSISAHTGKKFDRWIIAVLLAAVVLVTNTFVMHRDASSAADTVDANATAAELAKVPDNSVAVLPLANESGDPKQ